MPRVTVLAAALLVSACVAKGVGDPGPEVGQITYAGLTLGNDPKVRTVRWAYGFRFTVDPASVTRVIASCGDLEGTAVTIEPKDEEDADFLGVDAEGKVLWYGPERLLSNKSWPWLYRGGATAAVCQAVISRAGQPDSVARTPVTFTVQGKRDTIYRLEESHRLRKSGDSSEDEED